MITKEQAMTAKNFLQVAGLEKIGSLKLDNNGRMIQTYDVTSYKLLDKPNKWRASGKCQVWKTRPDEFKLPIKFGLYLSDYLTHENAHLFEVAE